MTKRTYGIAKMRPELSKSTVQRSPDCKTAAAACQFSNPTRSVPAPRVPQSISVRIELVPPMRAAVAAAILLLLSCNRDLATAKKALLARGDAYFQRGQYKQASVLYRLAVQKDKRYSLAYYKL